MKPTKQQRKDALNSLSGAQLRLYEEVKALRCPMGEHATGYDTARLAFNETLHGEQCVLWVNR